MKDRRLYLDLFVISSLALYLEMLLIRWIGSEIRIFAYLSNFILIACFLGFGIGCFQSKLAFKPFHTLTALFVIVFLVSEPLGITILPFRGITQMFAGSLKDFPVWNTWFAEDMTARLFLMATGTALTVSLFVGVLIVLIPLGRRVGGLFDTAPDVIVAYSVNVVGSLFGTAAFALTGYLQQPPLVWFAAFLLVYLYLLPRESRSICLGIALGAGIVLSTIPWHPGEHRTIWSPYQKLVISPLRTADNKLQVGYSIQVNNTGYQTILNLSRDFLDQHPDYFKADEAFLCQFDIAYRFLAHKDRVLIVGAGAGNDCSGALRNGAGQIDCVEIDPVIAQMGKEDHPEKPYDKPNVNLIIDDARSFFGKAKDKYDLVLFGALDSHTLGSAYNNVRLDHYVYTKESLARAKRLLKDDGFLVLIFAVNHDWIGARLYGLLEETFGHPPLAFLSGTPDDIYGGGGVVYVAAAGDPRNAFDHMSPKIRDYLSSRLLSIPPYEDLTTDDWPFLYLPNRNIPNVHLIVSGILLAMFLGFRKRVLRSDITFDWTFFCLGAGFLLVEVQSVTRAGLLFGSTWIVNCFVVSQVLVWILLSNLVYRKVGVRRIEIPLVLLLADLVLIYCVPLDFFSGMAPVPKLIVGSVHLTMPVFFAGLTFANLLDGCEQKASALGANLMGALVGGLTEATAFVYGQRSLIIIAGLFYAAALIIVTTRFRSRTA